MEPWSSRHLTRRSRTTLMGEMSDATKRKNSQVESRLEVQVKHMDRELQVKAQDLTHEQLLLQRALTARPSPARRQSLTNSAANFEQLKRREKDNMQVLDGKCRNFMGGEVRGVRMRRDDTEGDEDQDARGAIRQHRNRHRIPSVAHQTHDADSNEGSSESPSTDGEHNGGDGPGTQAQPGIPSPRKGGQTPRQRRFGVAHPTDVHLDIDLVLEPSENKNSTYVPLRRTTMQQQKFRRASTGHPGGNANGGQHQQQQYLNTVGRSKRESLDLSISNRGQQAGSDGVQSTGASTPEDANTDNQDGIPQIIPRQRKKSLPVVMGRQMRRHDRSSKSRESLLLPNLGQGRSPSPISDLRVKVTYADGEETSSVSDIPFKPNIIRSQRSLLSESSSGQLLPSARGPRLEIDLSIPMATTTSNPSSPRQSGRNLKREKTYTV